MEEVSLNLKRIVYEQLNSRQKENFNYAHVSAVLADYGFTTMRLTDDWQGADFIAQHVDGEQFIKVQLKGRLWVNTKYSNKDIWICFRAKSDSWYLYPHDEFLNWCLSNLKIGSTAGWKDVDDPDLIAGAYSWPRIPEKARDWLDKYRL